MPAPTAATHPRKPRPRRDGFDGVRRRAFLAALRKGGGLSDAARRAGVSRTTVYKHQESDRQFARQCDLAMQMACTDLELHAWERGVVGVEEPILYKGEVVGTRLKRSDAILRLLLQGANRKKYGPNPGFTRRRLHKLERERIEREVRAEHRELQKRRPSHEDLVREIDRRLAILGKRDARERTAAGWSRVDEHWIPPGWVYTGAPGLAAGGDGVPTPADEAEGTAHSV